MKSTTIMLKLTGKALKNVIGKIGYNARVNGDTSANKKSACYDLLSNSAFHPSKKDIDFGKSIIKKRHNSKCMKWIKKKSQP